MSEITIPWGDAPLALALPASWELAQVVAPQAPSGGDDWPERLAAALDRPEDSPPLERLLAARRGGKVVLVVEDATRHSPLPRILQVIFRELDHAQVPRENIEILFAAGMHPPMTAEQAAAKIGAELAAGVRWRSNLSRERKKHTRIGRISEPAGGKLDLWLDSGLAAADLRIIVSSVSPHLQAGFGGGAKMLLPGCASVESIRRLHLLGLSRHTAPQVGQTAAANRMRRLVDAAAAALDAHGGKTFGVQYVLDASDNLGAIACGGLTACQTMLAKRCAADYGLLVDSPADVVITSAFGRDLDLWQSFKAIANVSAAAKTGGVIICLTRCLAGLNGMPAFKLPISPRLVRGTVRLLGAESLSGLLTRMVPRLAGDAAFFVRMALRIVERNPVLMVSPSLLASGKGLVGLPLFAKPEEAFDETEDLLGPGPKRVILFPAGGITYPILRR